MLRVRGGEGVLWGKRTALLIVWLLRPAASPAVAESNAETSSAPDALLVTDDAFRLVVDERTTAEIEKLIPRLASPEFQQRETATTSLIEIGTPAFAKLRTAYNDSDDLELKLRIERIVHRAYFAHSLYGKLGFLGMRRAADAPDHDVDARIAEGQLGIKLAGVIAGTGAARAGMKQGDIIIRYDGAPFDGDPVDAFGRFAESIRKRGAGARVHFTVLRAEETLEMDVILGPMPRENLRGVPGGPELLGVADGRFHDWWPKFFRNPPAASD